jgi:CheY-like chemotaxis protein
MIDESPYPLSGTGSGGMAKQGITILVVDDEEDVREMIADGLSLDRYEVLTASGGEQALEVVRSHSIDVLITDFKMPGMSGVETAIRVREIAPHISIIVVTGYLTPKTEQECMGLGVVAFIRKPFEFHTLTAAVVAAVAPD